MYSDLKAVRRFTSEAFNKLANANLLPGTSAHSDCVSRFSPVDNAGCRHLPMVVDRLKGHDLPSLKLVNTVLRNLKTTPAGAYHALNYRKYGEYYLPAFCLKAETPLRTSYVDGKPRRRSHAS